jgi:hypothetical protein
MKKNPSKCNCCQAVKRCVFKVQNSDKQEMLQTRTLLSEQNLHLALNSFAKRPSSRNTAEYWRRLGSNETALTSEAFENMTVH